MRKAFVVLHADAIQAVYRFGRARKQRIHAMADAAVVAMYLFEHVSAKEPSQSAQGTALHGGEERLVEGALGQAGEHLALGRRQE